MKLLLGLVCALAANATYIETPTYAFGEYVIDEYFDAGPGWAQVPRVIEFDQLHDVGYGPISASLASIELFLSHGNLIAHVTAEGFGENITETYGVLVTDPITTPEPGTWILVLVGGIVATRLYNWR
jgi:hypothetical protein